MVDIYSKLSPANAQKLIRRIAANGYVTLSYHLEYESGPDRNYDFLDVVHILENGTVSDPPKYDRSHRKWKYRVEGKTIDGDLSIVITVIISKNELRAVTIFPK